MADRRSRRMKAIEAADNAVWFASAFNACQDGAQLAKSDAAGPTHNRTDIALALDRLGSWFLEHVSAEQLQAINGATEMLNQVVVDFRQIKKVGEGS